MRDLNADWRELKFENKVNLILKLIKKHKLTAYEIAKDLDITTMTVTNIINGSVKKPRERNINSILNFLYQNILNKDQPIITNNYKDEIVILKQTINELKADLLRENFKLFSMVMKNKDKLNELSKNFEDKKKSLN
tara:strand:- start:1527 stop:1934 length:408 start_codon:yes stop_codon:yes gene_type:complete